MSALVDVSLLTRLRRVITGLLASVMVSTLLLLGFAVILLSLRPEVGTASPSDPPSPRPSSSNPTSYFTGPLGNRNILPPKKGAFLFLFPSGYGDSIRTQKARVLEHERVLGRKFDGIHVHYGGGGTFRGIPRCIAPDRISRRPEQWIHDHGAIALTSWSPDRSIADVNAGLVDECFRNAANHFKRYRFTIMLRLWWEFDGNWMPWSGTGQPFVDAWRRVVNIFKTQGATNVGFWWCPNERARPTPQSAAIDSSYPGDTYVDWVGTDMYNWETVDGSGWSTPLHSGWAEFWELFDYTNYVSTHYAYGPRKPFVVGETGTIYDANAAANKKGNWFRDIPQAARNMKYLRGISFYDSDVSAVEGARSNFKVDQPASNADVYAGFKELARDPWFSTRRR